MPGVKWHISGSFSASHREATLALRRLTSTAWPMRPASSIEREASRRRQPDGSFGYDRDRTRSRRLCRGRRRVREANERRCIAIRRPRPAPRALAWTIAHIDRRWPRGILLAELFGWCGAAEWISTLGSPVCTRGMACIRFPPTGAGASSRKSAVAIHAGTLTDINLSIVVMMTR